MLRRSLITSKTLTPFVQHRQSGGGGHGGFTLNWCYSNVKTGLFELQLSISEVTEGYTFDLF